MKIAEARERHATAPSSRPATHWHIITGEYPPQPGGVSDYSRQIAVSLARAGDRVDVWAPPSDGTDIREAGVTLHRLPDRYGPRSLRLLGQHLDRLPAPRRLLVQYVPHAFGWKAANVGFCLWLRSRRRDSVWVMFHEVAFPLGSAYTLRQNALGAVQRLMAAVVGKAAERLFVSIPAWRPDVERLGWRAAPVTWMPVPSGIPVVNDSRSSAHLHERYAGGTPLVGHFGTYGHAVRSLLEASLAQLAATTDCRILLLGDGSDTVSRDLSARHPGLAGRIAGTGRLDADDVSRHVSACDVMLQPYSDGVSTRRTSAMVALAHGRPMVTTSGALTEPLWAESGALVLVPAGDAKGLASETATLLADRPRREQLSGRSRAMYAARFDLRHTIAALRG